MTQPLSQYEHWRLALAQSTKPAYKHIADLIEEDIDSGLLQADTRLPPLRALADFLVLNYTTVTRAYKEAVHRGLIVTQAGAGSYVKGKPPKLPLRGGSNVEMTMNLPPEPSHPELMQTLVESMQALAAEQNLYDWFRYQDFGGLPEDKLAAKAFLTPIIGECDPDTLLVCPGIHGVLTALVSHLGKQGDTIAVQSLIYPGIKAIASQLGYNVTAVPSDHEGPVIRALEDLIKTSRVAAIYLNPTLQNPTTQTISLNRRFAIADLAHRYSINIIEDDPYAMLLHDAPEALVNLAPELTYYVTGLSKCFGAGLRTGFLKSPSKLHCQRAAGTLRSLNVMTSPITNALTTQWINQGLVTDMIDAIRREDEYRTEQAAYYLADFDLQYHPEGFHIWLTLPKKHPSTASSIAHYLRTQGVSAVSSAAFCVDNHPPEALRLCLGGSMSRIACVESLKLLADVLHHPDHLANAAL